MKDWMNPKKGIVVMNRKFVSILSLLLVAGLCVSIKASDFETLKASDFNADGVINVLDLAGVASHFGAVAVTDEERNPDVNGDGIVNILDLTLVAGHLGKAVRPPAAVVSIEPTSGTRLAVDGSITVVFDNAPADVTVNSGTVTTAGKIVTIMGPFIPGPLDLTLSWVDGSHTLSYTVLQPDTAAPSVTGGDITDGDRDVDPERINSRAKIEIEFSETVSGRIGLRTQTGNDVGWSGKVEGNKAILTLVRGKELDNEVTYIIIGEVTDAAGNAAEVNIVFSTSVKTTTGVPIEVTDATFDRIVLESEFPIVVEFWAGWCPFCRQMVPIVDEVASEHRKTFAIAKLDIDSNPQIHRKYQVRGIPAYIVFQNGEIVGQFGGAMPKARFVQNILRLIRD